MFNDVEVEIVRGCHEFMIGLRRKRASCLWANSAIVCLICVDVRLNKVILGSVLWLAWDLTISLQKQRIKSLQFYSKSFRIIMEILKDILRKYKLKMLSRKVFHLPSTWIFLLISLFLHSDSSKRRNFVEKPIRQSEKAFQTCEQKEKLRCERVFPFTLIEMSAQHIKGFENAFMCFKKR